MTGWTVLLRGIRHRAMRSLVVLALAVIATAAAALAPAYTRAAQQSVLTDTLRAAPATSTSLIIRAEGTGDGPEAEPAGDSQRDVDAIVKAHPLLASLVGPPATAVETDAEITGLTQGPGDRVITRYAYRDRLCANLVVSGDCAIDGDQIMVSDRAAAARGWQVGDVLDLLLAKTPVKREIVGTYTPVDPGADYWGVNSYFAESGYVDPDTGVARSDAIFAGAEDDIRAASAQTGLTNGAERTPPRITMTLRYPIDVDGVRLDGTATLRDDLTALSAQLAGVDLRLDTAMPQLLHDVDVDRHAIATTVPLVAVPLVLLAFFVLMLLVSSLAEERGPEIALAKLRGYPSGRVARFGQGEVLLLITLATPLGIAGGFGIAVGAARAFLAEGTLVEIRWEPFAAGILALFIGVLAVWGASRRTVRANVLSLLRRVPHRSGWRAGALEGVAVALAAAAVYAAWRDRGSALAMLAAPLLAVVAGIGSARLLRVLSAGRLALARRRGDVAAIIANAQLSRRPGRHRVVTVMTVAVALLGFAATAWDVAAQARDARAKDAMGAARVYSVAAGNPQALLDAVRAAAPDGSAIPVVRRVEQYADGHVEVLGLPASGLADVVRWRGHDRADLTALAAKLHPPAPDPVQVSGDFTVTAEVADLGAVALRLAVLVVEPGKDPRAVSLGPLQRGTHTYTAPVPSGRFVGFVLQRPAADAALATLDALVTSAKSGAPGAQIQLADRAAWRYASERTVDAEVTVTPGPALRIVAESTGYADMYVSYLDAPGALPIVLAGSAPADDPAATELPFPAFAEQPQLFTVAATAPVLPRAGTHAILVDLEYALRQASGSSGIADTSALFYEVWTTPGAPDLRSKLAQSGVRVTRTETVGGYLDRLGRRAPALSLRLYLLAGGVAVALALGVVLLVTRIGAHARRMEMAALRVAGVPAPVLRRGLRQEYLSLLGVPVLLGFVVGVGGAWLMLPGIPLVTVGELGDPSWRPALGALPIAAAASLAALLLALLVATRLLRRSTPDLLRGDRS